jgi:hypothetical protein
MIVAMRLKRKIILPQNYSAYLVLFGCGSAALGILLLIPSDHGLRVQSSPVEPD